MKFQSPDRQPRSPARQMLTRSEKQRTDSDFSIEKDVDPYWNDMVQTIQGMDHQQIAQIMGLCDLLRLCPERRDSLKGLLSEERWPFYEKQAREYIDNNIEKKKKLDQLSPIDFVLLSRIMSLFPDHRAECADIDADGDACVKRINEMVKSNEWSILPAFLEAVLILFPDQHSQIPMEQIGSAFLKYVTKVNASQEPYLRMWLIQNSAETSSLMASLFPDVKALPLMQEYVQQIKSDKLPDWSSAGEWYFYLQNVTALATLSADAVTVGAEGARLTFKNTIQAPPSLPMRSVV